MDELPMPSDLKAAAQAAPGEGAPIEPLVEPPSAKLIARLFIIPLIIVAAAVGIMFLIGRMTGSNPSFEVALQRLWKPFGVSNHRFTTRAAVVEAMVARGWVAEGAAMCVLPEPR